MTRITFNARERYTFVILGIVSLVSIASGCGAGKTDETKPASGQYYSGPMDKKPATASRFKSVPGMGSPGTTKQ